MRTRDAPKHPETLKTKISLVGEQSVGKTSLIHRFVSGAFDETYIRTLGAAASKKVLDLPSVAGRSVHMDMTIMDVMGAQTFLELFKESYFRGANGILAVADLARRPTLDALAIWISSVEKVSGKQPVVLVANKADLRDDAEYDIADLEQTARKFDADYLLTSAKTGENVDEAFARLGRKAAERQLGLG